MNVRLPRQRKVFLKRSVTSFIIFMMVFAPLLIPRERVWAQIATVEAPGSPLLLSTLAIAGSVATIAGIKAAETTYVAPKDWMDRIAVLIGRAAIRSLTASIVSWINNGFQGNPAFVSDIEGYFRDVADQAIGEFINSTDFAFLCKPFQANIRIALIQQFAKKPKPMCRLSTISKNIDQFISGNFYDGGWRSWFVLTTDPYGNEYSSFINSSIDVQARILTAQGVKKTQLDFGRGFLSLEECTTYDYNDGSVEDRTYSLGGTLGNDSTELLGDNARSTAISGNSPNRRCSIVTPGAAIETQLGQVFGSDLRQLELANSFNQILDALMGQLIKQVFLGAGGLAGVSRPSSSTGTSFIQSYGTASNQTGVTNSKQDMTDAIASGLRNENEYKKLKNDMSASVTSTGALLESLAACYAEKLSPQGSIYGDQRTIAQERLAQASSTIAGKITPSKKEFSDQIKSAELNILLLTSLQDDVARVTSESGLLAPAKEFAKLQASGRMHNEISVADAQQQRATLVPEMDTIAAETRKNIEICKVFPNPLTP